MSDQEPLSELEQDFISHLRAKRGACPTSETLIVFQRGSLRHEEIERIESHVKVCGTCQLAVEMLKRFKQIQTQDLLKSSDLSEVLHRSRERSEPFVEERNALLTLRPTLWQRLKIVFIHPAFAYLLLLGLVYPAYLGLSRKSQAIQEVVIQKEPDERKEPTPKIASVKPFTLEAAERGIAAGTNVVPLAPEHKVFALSFLAPIHAGTGYSYDLEIRDSRGRIVAAQKGAESQDELGNFILICSRDLFPPGNYELLVNETNPVTRSSTLLTNFFFKVGD